jgi:hypothetical protein
MAEYAKHAPESLISKVQIIIQTGQSGKFPKYYSTPSYSTYLKAEH